jgi:hypothetical protein
MDLEMGRLLSKLNNCRLLPTIFLRLQIRSPTYQMAAF